jgi:hypothetical protein
MYSIHPLRSSFNRRAQRLLQQSVKDAHCGVVGLFIASVMSVPIFIRTIGMPLETLTNDRRTGKRNTRGN